jgi:hypothetical protein
MRRRSARGRRCLGGWRRLSGWRLADGGLGCGVLSAQERAEEARQDEESAHLSTVIALASAFKTSRKSDLNR